MHSLPVFLLLGLVGSSAGDDKTGWEMRLPYRSRIVGAWQAQDVQPTVITWTFRRGGRVTIAIQRVAEDPEVVDGSYSVRHSTLRVKFLHSPADCSIAVLNDRELVFETPHGRLWRLRRR